MKLVTLDSLEDMFFSAETMLDCMETEYPSMSKEISLLSKVVAEMRKKLDFVSVYDVDLEPLIELQHRLYG